jgi:hypothetical protein
LIAHCNLSCVFLFIIDNIDYLLTVLIGNIGYLQLSAANYLVVDDILIVAVEFDSVLVGELQLNGTGKRRILSSIICSLRAFYASANYNFDKWVHLTHIVKILQKLSFDLSDF